MMCRGGLGQDGCERVSVIATLKEEKVTAHRASHLPDGARCDIEPELGGDEDRSTTEIYI
jgi:hypothetical protein